MSRLIHEQDGNCYVVKLDGQFIGGEETDSLQNILKSDLPPDVDTIKLDMTETQYVNSIVLGVLIGANAHLKRNGKKLEIVNLPDNILELFKMTKLDRLLNLSY
jgi:anti-anti-sigma factor